MLQLAARLELRAEELELADRKAQAAARRRELERMTTNEYSALTAREQERILQDLGLDLPLEDRPPKADAWSRWRKPYKVH